MTDRPDNGLDAVKVPIAVVLLYNLAGYCFNLYDTVLYAWLPFVYTPPAGSTNTPYIPLFLFGIILAGGRILDAVSDPVIGYWSDHTRSRWGRRKPFIFVSAPVLFITFILVWRPPVEGVSYLNALYLGGILFIYYWAYTGFLIPWMANLPELSRKNDERVKIVAVGIVIGIIASMIGGGLSGGILETRGPLVMAVILGIPALIAGEVSILGIRETYAPPAGEERGSGFFKTMVLVFKDRQVLSFAGMIMFVQITYQLMLMNVPYMTTLLLGRTESGASVLMGEVILLMALSTPLWYYLLKKYPKRRVMRWIIALMALGFGLGFFVGRFDFLDPFTQAMIIFPVAAIPMGGMFTAALGLIADLTDYGEMKNGKRTEAVYYGIYGVVRKTGWAFCSLILTGTFSLFGYSVENPLGVRVIWILCAGFCLLGLLLFIPYKIGDSREETAKIMGL